MARDVKDIPLPTTRDLTFGRVISDDGPIPRLVVLDRMKQPEAKDWFESHQYTEWVNQFNHIRLTPKEEEPRVEVFFQGTIFVVVESSSKHVRRSSICRSFEEAKRKWMRGQLHWKEHFKF